ncbi:hypothetical protein DGMP_00140 [Desulfomarina profundi]|uniref:Hydrogenase maturation protease n=1 Tax=Desulfomarina profundi TaxID=2772557 RepID=A0A8D5FQ09_9BACT|nr:hypothetical protein DGMP_00140 [Desulfomarina profundi]
MTEGLVICIGNDFVGDDGVGAAVYKRLKLHGVPSGVRVEYLGLGEWICWNICGESGFSWWLTVSSWDFPREQCINYPGIKSHLSGAVLSAGMESEYGKL